MTTTASTHSTNGKVATPVQIFLEAPWCKGCAICADLCAKKVFVMKNNLPVIVNLSACTRCMLCEMRCPDFALTVV